MGMEIISLPCMMSKHHPRTPNPPKWNKQDPCLAHTGQKCFVLQFQPKCSELILLHTQNFPNKSLILPEINLLLLSFHRHLPLKENHPFLLPLLMEQNQVPIFLLNISWILLMAKASVITHTKLPFLDTQDLSLALQ